VTTPTISGPRVRVVLPQNKKARTATLYAPDLNDSQSLAMTGDGSGIGFTIPEIRTYALIAVQW
jgi:hypothetical protein